MKKITALILCLAFCLFSAAQGRTYKAGDTVTLGKWGGEAIEWQILEKKSDGTYVLMSVKGLDTVPYHTELTDVTWADCSLRAWLNGEFYENAFSASEKERIRLSSVENPGNRSYGTAGGPATEDRVYILSLEEVGQYFGLDPYDFQGSAKLICLPSGTALAHGAWTVSEAFAVAYQGDYDYRLRGGACWWWLRSPGFEQNEAADVDYDGLVGCVGDDVTADDGCVRPVICVRF